MNNTEINIENTKTIKSSIPNAIKKENAEVAIKLSNIKIDFGETIAVDGITAIIKKGELVTLLGPSGCGKTTTLNAIAGLVSLSSGNIYFGSQDVTRLSPQARKIGLVFQNYALYPHISVFANISFSLKNDEAWKRKIYLKNLRKSHEIDYYIFKKLGASERELRNLTILFDNHKKIDENFHVEFYKRSSLLNKEFDLLKDSLSNLKVKKIAVEKKMSSDFLADAKSNKKKQNDKSTPEIKRHLIEGFKVKLQEKKVDFDKEIETMKRKVLAEKQIHINSPLHQELKNIKQKQILDHKNNDEQYNAYSERIFSKLLPKYTRKKPILNNIFFHKITEKTNNKNKFNLIREKIGNKGMEVLEKMNSEIIDIRSAINNEVMEVAKKIEIESILTKKPTKLSGGQQQRVAIARGIAKKPKILLMDEPLSNLDAKLRVQTRQWIKGIQKSLGITTVFVTHDQEEAMSISDTIICMSFGKIQQIGKPNELYNRPINEFVAQFLGVPEMKIFDASIKNGLIKTKDFNVAEFSQLADYVKDIIRVGVRPEEFKINPKGRLIGKIDSFEFLGKEIQAKINFKIIGLTNVIIAEGYKLELGQVLRFDFDTKKIHLFDSKTKERVN